jgi:hypothetical protein
VGIRETLNKNPGITTGATAAIILIALIVIFMQLRGDSGMSGDNLAWYSTDDGKTWFSDDASKLPPFDKDGKKAYKVYVYKCADGKEFVSHLERYTPEAKVALEKAQKEGPNADPAILETVLMTGLEAKKPGTEDKPSSWIKQQNFNVFSQITQPKCPDGKTEGLEAVPPS